MMTTNYPGNPDLPVETQNRVIATFSQTLDLYTKEKMTDVLVGCDFILKLDPLFKPATDLMTKVQNPDSPIDLEPYIRTYLEETPKDSVDDLLIQAIEALNKKDYRETISICQAILQKDPGNAEARDIGQKAQESSEMENFINQFFEKAQEALAAGNRDEALANVKKGLALDPENEALLSIQQRIEIAPPAPEAAPPTLEAVPPTPEAVPPTPEAAPPTPEAVPGAGQEPPVGEAPEINLQEEAIDVGGDLFEIEEQPPTAPPESQAQEPVQAPSIDTSFEFEEPADIPSPPESEPSAPPTTPPPPAASAPPEVESAPSEEQPAAGMDFSFGMSDEDGSADERIKPILEEGDIAFREGKYQEAIDIWSRIYLIDMNSTEANERIERAKTAMEEEERQVEEIYNMAVTLYDEGKVEEAREKFQNVIKVEPQHLSARSYLQKIEKSEAPAPEAPPLEKVDSVEEAPLPGEMPLPPEPEIELPKKKSKMGAIVALVVIILLCVAGFILYPKIFPPKKTTQVKVLSADILIGHAKQLYELGKVDEAIKKLNQIKQNDQLYSRALELIQEYRQSPQTPATPGGQPSQHDYDTLIKQARQAIKEHRYLKALEFFTKAQSLQALSDADKALLADATSFAENYKSAQDAMNARNYHEAVRLLKNLQAQYPGEKEATAYLADAYYNEGVDLLKNKKIPEAQKAFSSVTELKPDDLLAKKNLKFCRLYQEYSPDLLFRIYIKYLPYR